MFLRETNTSTIFTSTCFFYSVHVSVMSVRKVKWAGVEGGGGGGGGQSAVKPLPL